MVDYNVELIENFLLGMSLTIKEFCWACDVPDDTVERIYVKDPDITVENILKIAYVLNVSLDTFLNHSVSSDIDVAD